MIGQPSSGLRASLALLVVVAAGCGSGSGGGSGSLAAVAVASSSTATTTTSSTSSVGSSASANASLEVVPLILIHGHGGDPYDWDPLVEKIAPGRIVLNPIYAKEAEALAPNSLPPAVVVQAGYYRDEKSGVKFDLVNGRGTSSIGSCPVARTDGAATWYPNSYAQRMKRIVDGVRRATGASRVDLCCHSMGTVVGRSYTKWLSIDPATGKSSVRRMLLIGGPNRGINALEATIDGLNHGPDRAFMRLGEVSEMCHEYKGWSGDSFMDVLNDDWDGFCIRSGVHYGGITATGAFGKQVEPAPPPGTPPPPPGPSIFGIKLTGPLDQIAMAIMALTPQALGEVFPLVKIWVPHVVSEAKEALSASDGTVRVESARMDKAPFLGSDLDVWFEGRHGDNWNPEQGAHVSRLAAQLVRTWVETGATSTGTIDNVDLKVVDAPGRASWIEVDVKLSHGTLLSAQLVEEKLDASGKQQGGATGYGAALEEGEQRFLFPVDRGGGSRAYHLVLYGPRGKPVSTTDRTLALTDGPIVEVAPVASLSLAMSTSTPSGPRVKATATSNAPANDPSLRYSWRIDRGAWTPYDVDSVVETPPLAAGVHEVELRARHAANGAAVAVDTIAPARGTIVVDSQGNVTTIP